MTLLCLASYEKGAAFLEEAKAQGARVLLVAAEKLRDADWPHDALDEIYYVPDFGRRDDVIHAVSYLARTERIDRIVPLDEFDLETAAALREHLRVPGMGQTTVRYFRDKLAMRLRARELGLRVPDFTGLFHRDDLRAFMERCPPPWILKPRSEASAIGLKKLYQPDDLWRALDELGDRQSFFLLEAFVPGDVYHVDALVAEGAVTFAEAHGYVSPPFEVMHGGGIFATRTLARDGEEAAACRALNRDLVQGFGMLRGAVHTEFIRSRDDGQFYFLETAARVGGANIPAMVEAATGVNLWRGWAQIELADVRGAAPAPLDPRADYAGLVISLAKQAWPDLAAYDDLEADGAASIAWRMRKKYHAGLALRAPDPATVEARLHAVMQRFRDDFHASLPAPATTDEL